MQILKNSFYNTTLCMRDRMKKPYELFLDVIFGNGRTAFLIEKHKKH